MCCATHIINLIVKDGIGVKDAMGIKVVEEGIGRIRETVGFWSATPKRHERFEKAVSNMALNTTKE